jgi:hypothetical protein
MKPRRNYIIALIFILICVIFFATYFGTKNDTQENFEDSKPSMELVIARYNESLNWIDQDPFHKYPITVYNKGPNEDFKKTNNITRVIPVENVGRCDHTYLYHVIQNYDNLADITVFLPGSSDMDLKYDVAKEVVNESENTKNTYFTNYTESVYDEFKDFSLDEWVTSYDGNKTINNESKLTLANIRPFGEWYKAHFGDKITTKYAYYGIFAVHKKHILQHPVEYYKDLIKELEVSSNPEVGHYFERAWGAVFGPLDE